MLTVDYDKLGLRSGDLLLDLGCGFGRHAFEAFRMGARVIACDMAVPELQQVRALFEAMVEAGEAPPVGLATAVAGDATRLPFEDGTFDRIIASEVMEHIPDDHAAIAELTRVLRPGGVIAVTIPTWLPEKVCWALSDEYYAPKAEGGHVRIYTATELKAKLRTAGLTLTGSHHAHALHSPYWWLKCAVGVPQRRPAAREALQQAPGVGHRQGARSSPAGPRRSSTRCSARAWWSTPRSPSSPQYRSVPGPPPMSPPRRPGTAGKELADAHA